MSRATAFGLSPRAAPASIALRSAIAESSVIRVTIITDDGADPLLCLEVAHAEPKYDTVAGGVTRADPDRFGHPATVVGFRHGELQLAERRGIHADRPHCRIEIPPLQRLRHAPQHHLIGDVLDRSKEGVTDARLISRRRSSNSPRSTPQALHDEPPGDRDSGRRDRLAFHDGMPAAVNLYPVRLEIGLDCRHGANNHQVRRDDGGAVHELLVHAAGCSSQVGSVSPSERRAAMVARLGDVPGTSRTSTQVPCLNLSISRSAVPRMRA